VVIKMSKKLIGLGMVGSILYLLHIIIGSILWKGYSQLNQPVSDLTSANAPNKALLSIFTNGYLICSVIFIVSLYIYTKKSSNKMFKAGAILFFVMDVVTFMYTFFPEDMPGTKLSFQGLMHIVITVPIVLCSILFPFFIGIGLKKAKKFKKFAKYSIITSVVIFISGAMSPIWIANNLPCFGLVERITIGAIQLWMFVCSLLYCFVYEEQAVHNKGAASLWQN